MQILFALLLTGSWSHLTIDGGANYGLWSGWSGVGGQAEVGYGLWSEWVGADATIGTSLLNFSREGNSYSFIDLQAIRLRPGVSLHWPLEVKLQGIVDYHVMFGSYIQEGIKYRLKELFLPGYGARVYLGFPLTPNVNLGVYGEWRSIYNFSNLSVFSGGFSLELMPGYKRADLVASARFDDSQTNRNGRLDSDEKAYIVVDVRNQGDGPARGVVVKTSISDRDLATRVNVGTAMVGYLRPGTSKILRIPVRGEGSLPDVTSRFTVTGRGRFGDDFQTSLNISTRQAEPPYLVVNAQPFDDNNDGIFDLGEQVGFDITVRNQGRGEAYRVEVSVSGLGGSLKGSRQLGNILPGASQTAEIRFQMPTSYREGEHSFKIVTSEAGKHGPAPLYESVVVGGQVAVALESWAIVDDDMTGISQGDGNGAIDKGERIELHVSVTNRGTSPARDVKAVLSSEQLGIQLTTPVVEIGDIQAGDTKEGTLVFSVTQDFRGKDVRFNLKLTEQTGTFPASKQLAYTLGEPPQPPPPPGGWRTNAYALVVGISRYKDYPDNTSLSLLRYAEEDAREIYRLLTDPNIGGIPKENAFLLLGRDATTNEIKGKLVSLEQRLRPGDYLYIFFSGHGFPGKDVSDRRRPYFLPYDAITTNANSMVQTAISMYDIESTMNLCKAEGVAAWVNACFFAAPMGSAAVIMTEYKVEGLEPNRSLLSASQSDQRAYEVDELRHSIFAYHLAKALRGEADSDNDGWVNSEEIFDYIEERVDDDAWRYRQTRQNPAKWGQGDFKVTKVPSSRR